MAEQGYSNSVLGARPPQYPPNGGIADQPPSKRPRLSPQPPNMTSYTSSQAVNYHPPFSPTQYTPISPAPSHQPMALNQNPTFTTTAGVMGPPEKPKADKQLDISALNDMVALAGVDLKKEEDYLAQAYRNQHTQSTVSNSFSPQTSFSQWSQSPTATQLSQTPHPHGPLTTPSVDANTLEAQIKAKSRAAAQAQAKAKQTHFSDPFLQTNNLRQRIQKQTFESAVRFRDDSIRLPHDVPAHDFVHVNRRWRIDADRDIISAGTSIVSADSSLPNILTLISLATQSRIRDVLEDAYASSRSRQYGSGGQVPPDWLDISTGATVPEDVMVKPQSISKTAWDAASSTPVKRKHDDTPEQVLITPPPDLPPTRSKRYPSAIPATFVKLGNQDLEYEKARLERRRRRKENQDGTEESSKLDAASPQAEVAPSPSADIKISKKERERQAKAGQTEEILQRNANETANLQLGGRSSKYSWMSAGPKATGGLNIGAGIKERLANKSKPAAPKPKEEDIGLESRHTYKTLGLLKEPPGITMLDYLNVLEKVGKEKKTLIRGLARLGAVTERRS